MKCKGFIHKLAIALVWALTTTTMTTTTRASAEIAVIVHPENQNKIDRMEISRIFLGQQKTFRDGSRAIPIDQDERSGAHLAFIVSVLKMNLKRVNTYWAKQLFSGKGVPPETVEDDDKIKHMVSENPSLIGYIDAMDVDDSVRVVYSF